MKRIDVTPKACEICGDDVPRRHWHCGKLESPEQYNRKRTCKRQCANRLRQKGRSSKRRCAYSECRAILTRKRRPSGIEAWKAFQLRTACDWTCYRAWLDETWEERCRKRDERATMCRLCEVEPARYTIGSALCRGCGYRLGLVADRWIARIPELAGRSERTHRTNLRKECEHGRIKGACRPCRAVELPRIKARAGCRRRREGRRFTKQFRERLGVAA